MKTPQLIWNYYHSSSEWRRTRAYIKSIRRGTCERCGKRGTEVHHKTKLTLDNFYDDKIRIGEGNLELLCKGCHDSARASEHGDIRDGLAFDENGDIIVIGTPPSK